jgi:hypothetical protein
MGRSLYLPLRRAIAEPKEGEDRNAVGGLEVRRVSKLTSSRAVLSYLRQGPVLRELEEREA